jgi:hypothetical protein
VSLRRCSMPAALGNFRHDEQQRIVSAGECHPLRPSLFSKAPAADPPWSPSLRPYRGIDFAVPGGGSRAGVNKGARGAGCLFGSFPIQCHATQRPLQAHYFTPIPLCCRAANRACSSIFVSARSRQCLAQSQEKGQEPALPGHTRSAPAAGERRLDGPNHSHNHPGSSRAIRLPISQGAAHRARFAVMAGGGGSSLTTRERETPFLTAWRRSGKGLSPLSLLSGSARLLPAPGPAQL